MAADGNLNEKEIKEMNEEPLPAETTSISAPDKLVESSDSPPPEPLRQDEETACDGPVASVGEEKDPQAFNAEESAGKANIFSSLSFPKKLWLLAESDEFKSIWWGHSGNSIVIAEEIFKVEVLGKRRPLRIFETESMKSFIRQLNLYGFTKMRKDFQRSPSLPEFLAEEDAFSAHKKLLCYYNPNFQRDAPHLLEYCQRRVALKRKAPQAGLDESCPGSIPDAQPGWRAAVMDVGDPLETAPALFPMAMLAAASAMAMLMPPNWQSPTAPHCPTCTCGQDGAAADNRMAP